MNRSASAPAHRDASFTPSFAASMPVYQSSELLAPPTEALPPAVREMSLTRHVVSRMCLDTTLGPAQLALRMNTQNLVNEMLIHKGKMLSHQLMLMANREQLQKPQKNHRGGRLARLERAGGTVVIPPGIKDESLFIKAANLRAQDRRRQKYTEMRETAQSKLTSASSSSSVGWSSGRQQGAAK
uniref:Uncharacterized protein n=1 Tax=Alexandrium catenella TaxID=2925 RepID=A0A7S1LAF2_ALECA